MLGDAVFFRQRCLRYALFSVSGPNNHDTRLREFSAGVPTAHHMQAFHHGMSYVFLRGRPLKIKKKIVFLLPINMVYLSIAWFGIPKKRKAHKPVDEASLIAACPNWSEVDLEVSISVLPGPQLLPPITHYPLIIPAPTTYSARCLEDATPYSTVYRHSISWEQLKGLDQDPILGKIVLHGDLLDRLYAWVGEVRLLDPTRIPQHCMSSRWLRMKRYRDPERLSKIAQMGCIVCANLGQEQSSRTNAHHIKRWEDGTKLGLGQKVGDDRTIPLCEREHHWNGVHVHMGSHEFEERFGNELELLDQVNALLS